MGEGGKVEIYGWGGWVANIPLHINTQYRTPLQCIQDQLVILIGKGGQAEQNFVATGNFPKVGTQIKFTWLVIRKYMRK